MTRRFAFILVLSCLAVAETPAHPNFSGRWRMVKDQSDFGKFQPPDAVIRVVDERGGMMNIHTIQTKGKNTTYSDISYSMAGNEVTNQMSGRPAVSKTFWDENTLVVRTETKDSKGEETHIIDRWDLSPDGQTLTIASHIETEDHSADLKLVCRKETAQ